MVEKTKTRNNKYPEAKKGERPDGAEVMQLSFEERFPSLIKEWNYLFETGIISKRIEKSRVIRPVIEKTCIDKARVKESFNKIIKELTERKEVILPRYPTERAQIQAIINLINRELERLGL